MQEITEKQYNSLVERIYKTLLAFPGMGLGEMREAREEAERIVDWWMDDNDIKLK